ncbi:hypothetical protein H310_09275 [Aphanomyces invadans]|uniref:Peptidase S54 rhomboid domain-containing protein n=1 Tax=Aphanomyces invadans TaxID=157072 RepID=A0A024TVC7_9STRA|nr:hypothetical protein H310_09275 [Aphanomyces invadans]ETV97968.1 hypothetical protein H310_09275 [Aphanomyces invadans]|eukprot:XP_008873529.1 hypothetical protein H310_09275 [Aphanomyces invadans]
MHGRRPFGNMPRHPGGRGLRNNGVLLMLAMQLLGQIQQLERKPPVTLLLMGGMVGLFLYQGHPGIPTARKYALCPDIIVEKYALSRLIVSAFLHVDEWHLYNNMASFLWKGVQLEFHVGSERFARMIGVLLVMSHVLAVVVAYILSTFMGNSSYIHQCAIGFSAVLFALKVVLNQRSPTYSTILGISFPTKYAAWVELVYLHYFVPGSSFVGHIAGIAAGYLYLYGLSAVPTRATTIPGGTRRPAYTYASGRATNSTPSTESDEEYARRLQEEEFRRR